MAAIAHLCPKSCTHNVQQRKRTLNTYINVRKYIVLCATPSHMPADDRGCPKPRRLMYEISVISPPYTPYRPIMVSRNAPAPAPQRYPVDTQKRYLFA